MAEEEESALHDEVTRRFGVLPNFFRLASDTPEITTSLFGFAEFAYLNNPLDSLFKERLFVYLSRFCEVRYCILRHVGFLLGFGKPAGDAQSPTQTVEEVIRLVSGPLPRREELSSFLQELSRTAAPLTEMPPPESPTETAIFLCAAHVFLQTPDAPRCLEALRRVFGSSEFQYLLVFLAFVRTAHFWTKVQTDLPLEDDIKALLAANDTLADALLNDPEASVYWEADPPLMEQLLRLDEEKRRAEDSLRLQTARNQTNEEELSRTSAELRERVAQLQKLNQEIQDSRRAALNVLEDAVLSREALRESEERYRTLFASIDEGFNIIEMVYTEAGECVDYRWLEVNRVFERQTGLRNTVGRLGSEIAPNTEPYWLELYDRVARTGEPQRIEKYHADTRRWYQAFVSRIGGEGSRQVAVVFDDVTERKQREEQQEFRLALMDALRLLSDPFAVPGTAMRLLGTQLQADRVFYAEMMPDDITTVISDNYVREGVARFLGEVDTRAFGDAVTRLRNGQTVVLTDVTTDEFTEAEKSAYAGNDMVAAVAVPLVKRGAWVATLVVHSRTPRDWTALEVALVEETAEQTWAAVERAYAETALRESEERLGLALEIGEMASWDWDLRSGEVTWNDRHFRMMGYAPGEVTPNYDAWLARVHPENREETIRRIEAARDHRLTYAHQFRCLHPDGRVVWCSARGRFFYDTVGQPYRMIGVMEDTTERNQAEAALRESEARFRTLSDAVPQVIWTNSADGTANYFNRRWYDYTGLTYAQSAGPGWQAIVHPDDAPASVEKWQYALAQGEVFDTEYRLRSATGEYRWFIGRNVPLKAPTGAVTAWFGSATDIHDLKQVEAARRESEERFRLLVEGAKDYAMFLLDTQNRITFWSAGAERVFGWTEAEAVRQSGEMIFTPQDRAQGAAQKEIERALTDGRAPDRRWHIRKDRSLFWADGVLMRLDDDDGNLRGFAKVARDATAQKHAEVATQAALEAVAQANEALEQRVEERTHELSEMSALRQELLRKLVAAQEEERGRISRDLHDDTGQQIASLLLSLGHLKNNPIVAENEDAQRSLEQAQLLAQEVAQKSHRISFTLRPTVLDDLGLMGALKNYIEVWTNWSRVPTQVEGVGFENRPRLPTELETTIYRVTQEGLTNILKHAVSSDIPQTDRATRVSVLVQRRPSDILAVIEDNGPGFDVEAALSRPPGERRLGIFGMQERARLVGGTLDVESTQGEGTIVYLRLPLPPTE